MSTKTNNNQYNKYFMKLALMQAKRMIGNTSDNPSVGCVITKNNNLVSSGVTSFCGRPHAEYQAIKSHKKSIKDSNLYVTLEPCSHYGKTPPCVNLIIKNKIKKVYFGMKDPDIRSYNKSTLKLKKASIKVENKIHYIDINKFYRSYIRYKSNDLPFVTSKIAISKDFKTISKKSKFITNEYSRARVHLLRSQHDCILTSSETIIKDNPLLNCRINGLESRSPTIIILDKNNRIPIKSKIFNKKNKAKTIVFYSKKNLKKLKILNSNKIKFYKMPIDNKKNFDLKKILKKVKQLGYTRVFLESGATLTENFFKSKLINDFYVFISKYYLKSNGSGDVRFFFNTFLKKKIKNVEKIYLFGDKLITYRIK